MNLKMDIKKIDPILAEAIENYGEKEFIRDYNKIALADKKAAQNFILIVRNFYCDNGILNE